MSMEYLPFQIMQIYQFILKFHIFAEANCMNNINLNVTNAYSSRQRQAAILYIRTRRTTDGHGPDTADTAGRHPASQPNGEGFPSH